MEEGAVAELLERVAALERRLGTGTAAGAPSRPAGDPAADDDLAEPFWALNQLKRHEPRPVVLYTGRVETALGEPVEWQMGHDATALLDEDWTVHAPALAALGHPTRLQILQLVARGEARTAAEMAHSDGLGTTGQIYHHLRLLVAAGWLRTTTKGRHDIPPERLVPLLVILGASR